MTKPWLGKIGALFIQKEDASFRHTLIKFRNGGNKVIQDLACKNILTEDIPKAKRPSYSIVFDAEDLLYFFTDVHIALEKGIPYFNAMFKGHRKVTERILPLDAECYQNDICP